MGFVTLSIVLLISLTVNVVTVPSSLANKTSHEEQRMPKDIKIHLQNSSTIECQREFFLFHQDHVRFDAQLQVLNYNYSFLQNHVCEVTGILIKNDTNVTINGNSKINVLYIFNFEVYRLPKEIFTKFISLKHLIVNGNHMQILENDTFEGAQNLEVLRLSNNELTKLDSYVFRVLRNLKTLDLGRNKIETVGQYAFSGLENLERLYLSDNCFKFIREGLFYPLLKLASLSLENNQISELEDTVFKENKLMRSIGLSNNTFRVLQNGIFRYFENLTDLSISELRIKELDLNGTSINTLVIRNTDIVNITLSNFPKILVTYGTALEFIQFIIDESTADFKKIPNWGGMFYNKEIRFLFYFKRQIVTQENMEAYDGGNYG